MLGIISSCIFHYIFNFSLLSTLQMNCRVIIKIPGLVTTMNDDKLSKIFCDDICLCDIEVTGYPVLLWFRCTDCNLV